MYWLREKELIFKPGNRREVRCVPIEGSERIKLLVKQGAYSHEFEFNPECSCKPLRYIQSSHFDRANALKPPDVRVVESAILVDKLVKYFGAVITAFFEFPFYKWD